LPRTGGVETFVRDLSAHLKSEANVDSIVCVCATKTSAPGGVVPSGEQEVLTVPVRGPNDFKVLPRLPDLVGRADVVHLHEAQFTGLAFHFAVHDYGVPVVASTHGGFFHTRRLWPLKRAYARTLLPWILRRLDLVIASSENDERTFRPLARDLVRIDNGIDVRPFNRVALSRRYEGASLVYFGRLSRNKRLDRLLRVLACIRDETPGLTLHVVGEDFDRQFESLESLRDQLRLSDIVRFHGPLPQERLLDLIASTPFFVSATEYEGFGIAVLEAMAAGCVPVVSRIAPITGFIADGHSGFLVDFDDREGAAQRLRAILAMGVTQRRDVSRRAIRRAAEFSWDRRVDAFVSAYRYAIAKRRSVQ
jgi:alpha-1,3-mannosyltransferase